MITQWFDDSVLRGQLEVGLTELVIIYFPSQSQFSFHMHAGPLSTICS